MNMIEQVRKDLRNTTLSPEEIAKGAKVSVRSIAYIRDTDRDSRFSTIDKLYRFFESQKKAA